MPLAVVVAPLIIEVLPLDDPLLGWRANSMFYVRTAIRATVISFLIDSQSDLYIPEQKQPMASLIVMNCIQGGFMAGSTIAIAAIANVFPVPFVATATAPIYAVLSWILRTAFIRVMLPAETDPGRISRIERRLPQVMRLASFGLVLVYIYNAFAAAFTQVPDRYRVAMAVLLYLIKMGLTRREWMISHIGADNRGGTLDDTEDLATAHVASGVRFFHSLFTATCLQNSNSYLTLTVIVAFAFAQDVVSIHALADREQKMARAMEALARSTNKNSTPDQGFRDTLWSIAVRVRVCKDHSSGLHEGTTHTLDRSFYVFREQANAAAAISPLSQTLPHQPATREEMTFLLSAARLFHCREAVLLRLYIEIFVPLVYFVYITLVQFSPNIAYLPALQDGNLSSLAGRLAIQGAFKVVAVAYFLRRHSRESGGLKQLVFALSSMRTVMLSNCLKNALGVFDFPLLHNGHDFSFRFQWLRGPS